jgi:4'-phosphopantetheinyl transferase EntD
VLIGRRARYASVGVDLDDERPLGEAAAADLMSGEEIELMQEIAWAGERSEALNVVFCAKEALFKCQYPLSGRPDLDFEDVRLTRSRRPGMLGVTTRREAHGIRALLETIGLQLLVVQSLRVVLAFAAPGYRPLTV